MEMLTPSSALTIFGSVPYCFVSCLVLKILMFYNLSLLFVFFLHYIRAKERHNGKCVN